MPSVCFYFQVHQPFRLAPRSCRPNENTSHSVFDDEKNGAIMRKVAEKCYLPTNKKMLDLINRFDGQFRISYSVTGTAIEQMERYSPETLQSFIELSKTGCVEFIGETYYHSLAAVYDSAEFKEQVKMHCSITQKYFNQTPRVFRNTELIYSDAIGKLVSELGYDAVIAEGADDILQWRSPNYVYSVAGEFAEENRRPRLLLKNYKLSDDIAFRFSNRQWESFPLMADTFASWVHKISGSGETVNLFMDYETFGEHQWASTGIFEFLDHLPQEILRHPDWKFSTPSEVIAAYPSVGELSFNRLTSWADVDRDLTAWRGNNMQCGALDKAFRIGEQVKQYGDKQLCDTWRKLLTSDHFYYMCTKWFADGDVHAYFSPYENPYEAFINYMNAFKGFVLELDESKYHSVNVHSKVLSDCIESTTVFTTEEVGSKASLEESSPFHISQN